MTEKTSGEVVGWLVPESLDLSALTPDIDPPAKSMYERIARQIIEFESHLSPDEEIGGRFVSAPREGVIHIENIGYWAPDMLIFKGTDADGRAMRLLQHYSQMTVLLCAVPKEKEKARRIGFILHEQLSNKKSDASASRAVSLSIGMSCPRPADCLGGRLTESGIATVSGLS